MTRNCCGALDSKNLTLHGEPKARFAEARWLRRGSLLDQGCFLFFRGLLAFYWIGWVGAHIVSNGILWSHPSKFRWLIYYTNWSALLLGAYFAVAFLVCLNVTVLLSEKKPSERNEPLVYWESETIPKLYKLMWILHETSGTAQLVTVLIYWVLVYNGHGNDIFNIHLHGVGLFLWLLNTIFSNTPTRVLHVYFPFLYSAAYIGFTIIYYIKDGISISKDGTRNKYIYEALDYDKHPGMASIRIAVVLLAVLPLGHIGLSTFSYMWEKIAELTGGYNKNDPSLDGSAQLTEMAKRRAHALEEV